MKSGVKTAISLLIAVVVFALITIASSLGMFSSIEKSFYEPAKIKSVQSSLDQIAVCSDEYISSLLKATGATRGGFMSFEDISSFVSQKPSDQILREWKLFQEKYPEAEGIRVIDSKGRRIHYSSFRSDSRLNGQKRIFSYYSDIKNSSGESELDYSVIDATLIDETGKMQKEKLVFDSYNQRFILSYPIEVKSDFYTVAIYFNLQGLKNLLVQKSLISFNEPFMLVASEDYSTGAVAFNVPKMKVPLLLPKFESFWKDRVLGPVLISESFEVKKNASLKSDENVSSENLYELEKNEQNEKQLSLKEEVTLEYLYISDSKNKKIYAFTLLKKDYFLLPDYVRILLLVSGFITVCLFVLILICFKKDDEVVIKNRIKRFQLGILNEFLNKNINKAQIAGKIQANKEELSKKIKKDLGKRGKKHSREIDAMLEQSWLDIVSALLGNSVSGTSSDSIIDMDKLKKVLEEVISSTSIKVQTQSVQAVQQPERNISTQPKVSAQIDISEVEAVEELAEAEAVEELADAEPVEELVNAEPVEELADAEPVEELADAEPVEELAEAEPVEELADDEVVEELADAEPVEELANAEAVEELADAEPVEEIADAEPVEELADAEPVEELAEAESVEELAEAEAVEELTDVEPVEELADAEPVEELAEAEVVEELANAEPVEELAEAEPVASHVWSDEYENTEPLEFSFPADKLKLNSNEDDFFIDNFIIEDPVFKELDLQEVKKIENQIDLQSKNMIISSGHEKYLPEKAEQKSTLAEKNHTEFQNLPLEEKNESEALQTMKYNINTSSQFMFTAFAANNNNITELQPDVIVADDDGVFCISSDADKVLLPPKDLSFKNLVDSVLH